MEKKSFSPAGAAETLPITPKTRNQHEIADLSQNTALASPKPALSLDDLALFPSTKRWMLRHSILPSQWNLSADEAQRIASAGIRITVYNTPASCLPLVQPIEVGLKHLIVVDPAPLDSGKLTPRQVIATLLHEIGHVVNLPTPGIFDFDYMMQLKGVREDEVFADDYARHCGYGTDFADALELMKQAEPASFDTEAVKYRIERIRTESQLNRNLTNLAAEPK